MRARAAIAGKRILVTGGTTGIGRATVALLAEEGGRILPLGRDADALRDCLARTASRHGAVTGMVADVATCAGVAEVFAQLDAELGGIDILVTCAALGAGPIHEMADDAWRYVVETNLLGTMACARAAIQRMPKGGHLLFVGSISSDIKAVGESVYAATKAGIDAFAATPRKEVADRAIKVSVVQPGSTATDMQQCSDADKREAIARHEMLNADEVAETILFVLTRSKRADLVNLRIEPQMQKYS